MKNGRGGHHTNGFQSFFSSLTLLGLAAACSQEPAFTERTDLSMKPAPLAQGNSSDATVAGGSPEADAVGEGVLSRAGDDPATGEPLANAPGVPVDSDGTPSGYSGEAGPLAGGAEGSGGGSGGAIGGAGGTAGAGNTGEMAGPGTGDSSGGLTGGSRDGLAENPGSGTDKARSISCGSSTTPVPCLGRRTNSPPGSKISRGNWRKRAWISGWR